MIKKTIASIMIPRLILWMQAKPIATPPTIVTLLPTIVSALSLAFLQTILATTLGATAETKAETKAETEVETKAEINPQRQASPIQPSQTIQKQTQDEIQLNSPLKSPRSSPGVGDTFVHLFEWRWLDVAQECETFLAPAGYRAVQVSPPQEHVQGGQWWTRYQPVSYQLQSRGGSAAEFAEMVQRCQAVGVEVYGDAVFNHMAAGSGVGTAGNAYGDRLYPDYTPFDFHVPCEIQPTDYLNDRWRVQHCDLVKLPDLRTESPRVQGRIAAYLQDLLGLGVTGFRLDAAKHVPPEDIARILERVEGQPFIFQEVIDPGYEAIGAQAYLGNGWVTDFQYGKRLGPLFRSGRLADLKQFSPALPSQKAIVFIDNHDNQRGHGGGGAVLTFAEPQLYTLATVFMLAYPYGYVQVMSSYDFQGDTDAGPPTIPVHGQTLNCGITPWQCEHRWPAIVGAVDFRHSTQAYPQVSRWWDNGNRQIAFGRGSLGHLVINGESTEMVETIATDLPAGTYCNLLQAPCDPITINAQGQMTARLAPLRAIAVVRE
jgi:alpha-amylase